MLTFNPEFREGSYVAFKTDVENYVHLVTGYLVHGKEIMYEVSLGGQQRVYAYAIELEEVEVEE